MLRALFIALAGVAFVSATNNAAAAPTGNRNVAEPIPISDDVAKKILEIEPMLASSTGELDLNKFNQLAETEKSALINKVTAQLPNKEIQIEASELIKLQNGSIGNITGINGGNFAPKLPEHQLQKKVERLAKIGDKLTKLGVNVEETISDTEKAAMDKFGMSNIAQASPEEKKAFLTGLFKKAFGNNNK